MSRRDTIIIAVLVNAGLLMVLFATAMRGDVKKVGTAPKIAKVEALQEIKEELTVAKTSEEIIFSESLDSEEIVFLNEPVIEEPIVKKETPTPSIAPRNTIAVTVKQGDILEKIAKAHGTSVAAIMEVSDLKSTELKIGQVLEVPVDKEKLPIVSEEEYYVVQDGDNPWLIATKNKVKWEDLLRLNNLDEQKARKLRPGDRLRLR